MKTLWLLSLVALGAMTAQAQAGGCCPGCGCQQVKKVCCLVCETRKTTNFVYDYECEDFCIPGPSPCCRKCVKDCSCKGFHMETIFGKPKWCGCVRTRHVLVKIPVTTEKQVWTCEVKRLCCGCGYSQNDPQGTIEARARQIMPVSAEEPLVLEEQSSFEAAPAQPVTAAAVATEATDESSAPEEPADAPAATPTLLSRLRGR